MSPFAWLLLVVVIIVICIGLGVLWLVRTVRERQRTLLERFPTAVKFIPNANFIGQESSGVMQVRGNGTFVLTHSDIVFERWIPRAEYTIPLDRIESIDTPMNFLGKTVFRPLLKVVYRNESGELDAMAWLVPDLDELKRLIEANRRI